MQGGEVVKVNKCIYSELNDQFVSFESGNWATYSSIW
jgi:hypothetical protein